MSALVSIDVMPPISIPKKTPIPANMAIVAKVRSDIVLAEISPYLEMTVNLGNIYIFNKLKQT